MPFNRTSSRVVIGLFVVLLASPALGQGPQGMQLFAPADVSTFGGGQPPNEGYFFTFDGLYWSIQKPETALIGSAGSRLVVGSVDTIILANGTTTAGINEYVQQTTESTAFLRNNFQPGERYELGRVENGHGWMVSGYRLRVDKQSFIGQQSGVLLGDSFGLLYGKVGEFNWITLDAGGELVDHGQVAVDGNLPVKFDTLVALNTTSTWSIEASYLRRTMTFHNGGNMEFYLGARYLEFDESFSAIATGGLLDNSYWNTSAGNHIVGPQVGARYYKQQGRWKISTEGRFMAGYNSQNLSQDGAFLYTGSPGDMEKPEAWSGGSFNNEAVIHEFSPLVELRVDVRYQVTRAISLRAGWTGIWMDGIARPANMILYQVPDMGLNTANNRQDLLINGLTLGIDINR